MIAADRAGPATGRREAAARRRRRPHRTACRARTRRLLRPGDLVIANDAATLPASLPGVTCRRGADRSAAGRRAVRSRRTTSCASRRSCSAPAISARAPKIGRCRRRSRRATGSRSDRSSATSSSAARPSASRVAALRGLGRARSGPASRGTAGRSSTRTSRSRWRCGMCGRRSPARRSRSSRRPPASCSTGSCWRRCASAGIVFATITHAAGISSTGDPELDRRLPFDEPYRIPAATAQAIASRVRARAAASSRSARRSCARSSTRRRASARSCEPATASRRSASARTRRCASSTRSSPARTSRHEPLRAAARVRGRRDAAPRGSRRSSARGYRTHEFGDSVLIERASEKYSSEVRRCDADVIFAANARTGRAARSPYTSRFLRAAHVVQEPGRLSPAGRLVGCSC